MKQNLRALVDKERIHRFAPEENTIYLLPPPFHTVARLASGAAARFWAEFAALDEIAPEAAVVIADFGLGSDAPILLDYHQDVSCPSVLRLRWSGEGGQNHWVSCASNFDDFADLLGLESSVAEPDGAADRPRD